MTADARVVLDRLAHLSTSASAAPWVAGENLTIGGWALYPPGSPVGTGREVADFCREDDARLIAAARNTLPALVVALQAVLDLHVESESARALRKAGTATRYCVLATLLCLSGNLMGNLALLFGARRLHHWFVVAAVLNIGACAAQVARAAPVPVALDFLFAAAWAWCWWRNGGGDDFRKRRRKAAARVREVAGRLVVVVAPEPAKAGAA